MKSFGLACFLAILVAGSVLGTVENARGTDSDLEELSTIPTQVTSDKVVWDRKAGEVTPKGNVVIDREDLHISADTIRLNPVTGTYDAEGNVQANFNVPGEVGEVSFSGDRLEYNIANETGAFYGGTLFLKKYNYHVQAEKIEEIDTDTFWAEDVILTTCDGESPAWEVEGKEIDVTIEGYGKVKNALFRIKEVPVFYFPFIAFPVMQERQSGLLAPQIGFSDRKGSQIDQPYFRAISDNSDATIYADYMSERGVKPGIEYRYFLSEDDKGAALFDYLSDRKVDDGTGTSSQDWGYDDDVYLRPNSDRYWFRMKHDQVFGQSALRLDLDMVSDQDYLYDFRDGYSGYTDSRGLFEDIFSRSLDDYNDPVRRNRLSFSTQWSDYSLNAEVLWWDDVIARRLEETDDTVQSLPAINFDRYKKPLFDSILYAGFETETAYFYREDGGRGGRIDLYPRLYLPGRLGNVLSIEPSLGGRETLWQVDRFDDDATDTDRTRHRELYDFELDLSSEIYNVFKPNWGEINGLKHSMKFQVEYDFTPTLDQESYPEFDGVDRIDDENLITYSVINTFTTRRGDPGAYSYDQAVRFELSQSYDVGKERAGEKPFNPIEGDLQLDFGNWCNLQGDAAWSIYDNEFVSHNITYNFSDRRGDGLKLQHRYKASSWETIYGAVTLKMSDRIWLFSEYERNLEDDLDIEKSVEALYRARCWSLGVRYKEEDDSFEVGFRVTFYNLGAIGNGPEHNEGLPAWAGGE